MKELNLEEMELIHGGTQGPDASCVVKHGLSGAVALGSTAWITGVFWPAATMGGLIGGFVHGIIMCEWY